MVARGAAVAPVRGHIDLGEGSGTFLISGVLTELDLLSVKVINVRPANPAEDWRTPAGLAHGFQVEHRAPARHPRRPRGDGGQDRCVQRRFARMLGPTDAERAGGRRVRSPGRRAPARDDRGARLRGGPGRGPARRTRRAPSRRPARGECDVAGRSIARRGRGRHGDELDIASLFFRRGRKPAPTW